MSLAFEGISKSKSIPSHIGIVVGFTIEDDQNFSIDYLFHHYIR